MENVQKELTKIIRNVIRFSSDKNLLEMWEKSKLDTDNEGIILNAVIEAELENRNIIRLNPETFEYDFV